jgi:hypothetical protein
MENRGFSGALEHHSLQALHGWALAHRDAWPADELFDRVLRATLADATKTFGAIALQAAHGYGPTALKNARSLFESLVVAYWMTYCADHEWVVERMREHQELGKRVLADAIKQHPDWWEALGEPQIDDIADEDGLVALYGRYGEESWWANEVEQKDGGSWKRVKDRRRSLRTLVSDLMSAPEAEGRLWDFGDDGKTVTPLLQIMVDIPHRVNNLLVHHTPAGLTSLVDLKDDELVFDDEPSDEWVPQAQIFAYVIFSLVVQLFIDRYRNDLREDFEAAVDSSFARAWVTLAPEQQRLATDGAHRNQPCPCGSGLKTKHCHAA